MTDRVSPGRGRTYPVSIAPRTQEVDVPLSENEQRLLEQMERALYAEDPKWASAMRGAVRRSSSARRLLLGIGGVVPRLGPPPPRGGGGGGGGGVIWFF